MVGLQSVQNIVSIITKIYEMECWNNRDSREEVAQW